VLAEGAAIGYATVGAATLQGLVFLERLRRWQAAREVARSRSEGKQPALSEFIDAPADLLVACASIAFGALGGWLMAGEINGVPLALVAGAAAPEVLAHVCRSTPLMNLLLQDASPGEAGPVEPAPATVEGERTGVGERGVQ
jgi:hypothetical protein